MKACAATVSWEEKLKSEEASEAFLSHVSASDPAFFFIYLFFFLLRERNNPLWHHTNVFPDNSD